MRLIHRLTQIYTDFLLALAIICLLPACSSLDFEREVQTPTGVKVVRAMSFRNTNVYGGKIEAVVNGHGYSKLTITPTPSHEVPRRIRMRWDRNGIMREYDDQPLTAQINQSDPLKVIWDGAGWVLRSASNLAGTIASAIVGGQVISSGVGAAP